MLSEKPWKPESVLRFGLWLLLSMSTGVLVAGLLAGGDQSSFLPVVITTLSFHGAIILILPFFLREHGVGWSAAFGFRSPGEVTAVLVAALAAMITLPIAWSLNQIAARAMTWLQLEPVAQTAVTTLQQTSGVAPQLYLAFMAVGMAPVAEELLFRGILYPFARRRLGSTVAVLGTSLLFGAVHFNLMTFLPLTFLGLMLAWLYEFTGNLLAPIVAHSLFNLANFFWLVIDKTTL